jgi:hypothetical protein
MKLGLSLALVWKLMVGGEFELMTPRVPGRVRSNGNTTGKVRLACCPDLE